MADKELIELLVKSGYLITRLSSKENLNSIEFLFSGKGNPIKGVNFVLRTPDIEALVIANDLFNKQ